MKFKHGQKVSIKFHADFPWPSISTITDHLSLNMFILTELFLWGRVVITSVSQCLTTSLGTEFWHCLPCDNNFFTRTLFHIIQLFSASQHLLSQTLFTVYSSELLKPSAGITNHSDKTKEIHQLHTSTVFQNNGNCETFLALEAKIKKFHAKKTMLQLQSISMKWMYSPGRWEIHTLNQTVHLYIPGFPHISENWPNTDEQLYLTYNYIN